jgi:hypothetical protein
MGELEQLRAKLEMAEKEKRLLLAVIRRLQGLLKQLEWAGGEYADTCPACGAIRNDPGLPHVPDCWLTAELGDDAGRAGA